MSSKPRQRCLHGHCLPYGEGITYWPLTEVVRELLRREGASGAESSSAALAELLPGEGKAVLIAELIFDALGLGASGAGTGEVTSWAVRKLFEALAQRRPLVIVFDDLQWAEPTFLEPPREPGRALARRADPAALPGAPELFETHPGWGGGRHEAATLLLEPLDDGDCKRLIANLLGRGPLPAVAEHWIAEAADGNALFAEELLAMLVDDDLLTWNGASWVVAENLLSTPVPTTLGTLLAARLEGLPRDERALLALASVEGTLFHRSALSELAPELPESFVERSLTALAARDVIRTDQAAFPGDAAYRFRHPLIRDAAYRSLPTLRRAEQHERFAAWLERIAADRLGEFEEIVGYHLERAYRYRLELGGDASELAARASERLEAAGRRALARGDLPASIGLLERAASVSADDLARRAELLPELGAALIAAGRLPEADWVLDEARLVAAAYGRRPRGGPRARAAAVPAPAAGHRRRHRGRRADGGARASHLRALRRPSRTLQRPAARGLAALERGARGRGRRGLGARGQARQRRWRRARARRDPHLDRLVAVVRPDADRRGHPPLRGASAPRSTAISMPKH